MYAIIGTPPQVKTSDNRDCDYRSGMASQVVAQSIAISAEATEVFRRLEGLGLRQRDLAQAIGIEENKISKVKSGGRQLKASELVRANQWLDDAERRSDRGLVSDSLPTLKSEGGSVGLKHLDLSFAMGDGTNIDDYFEEGVFEFDAALLRAISRAPAHRLVVGRGIGDSMMPTIHDDAMVIFDTTQTALNSDDRIWAISLFGAGSIKRLQLVGRGRVLVISDNPTVPNKEVDQDDIRILGRVIWSARRH